MKIQYTMFMSLAQGGYSRLFKAVDYPGITGNIHRDTRKKPEVRKLFYKDQIFATSADAIEAWKKDNGGSDVPPSV